MKICQVRGFLPPELNLLRLLLCEQVERDHEFYLVIYLQFLAILWVKFGYYKDVLSLIETEGNEKKFNL